MELTDDAPQFPKLPFLAGDAALIAVAAYIAYAAESPLPAPAIYTIAACVGLGAALAALPFIIDYNRRQEALLTDRQNALEALARTAAAAAEQASIAASGLHEIAELAQKNLRLADQLPQKLHERVNEFNRTQDDALAAELESLQQEVNTLRASEAEKLDSAADKIHRSAIELAKLDTGLRQQLATFQETAQRAQAALTEAAASAMAANDQRLAATSNPPASTTPATPTLTAPVSTPVTPTPSDDADQRRRPRPAKPHHVPADPSASDAAADPAVGASGSITATVASEVTAGSAPGTVATAIPPPPAAETGNAPEAGGRKPPPKRRSAEQDTPLLGGLLADDSPSAVITEPVTRRAPRPPSTEGVPTERSAHAPEPAPAPVAAPSSDGATRLIVTAYIGIGNKLFVRGDAPNLSWERGVPLQFVSIGKWRWESSAVGRPIALKLFKNDETECTALGEVRLRPGQQHEVTATF